MSEGTLEEIDSLLARTCELSKKVPTTSDRLKKTTDLTNKGNNIEAVSANEAKIIESLQKTTFYLRETYAMLKNEQDERCKQFEESTVSF